MSLDHDPVAQSLYQGWMKTIQEGPGSAAQKEALLESVATLNLGSGCATVEAAAQALKSHLSQAKTPDLSVSLHVSVSLGVQGPRSALA